MSCNLEIITNNLAFTAPLTLLTVAPLTLTFPFALSTYLFVAHTLSAPEQALGAALLAGGVTAIVGLFCVGLVRDALVALSCYLIFADNVLPATVPIRCTFAIALTKIRV